MSDGVFRPKPRRRTKTSVVLSKAGTQTLTPSLLVNANTFGAGTQLNLNVKPGLFTDTDGFFAATLFNGKALLVSLFVNDQLFFDVTVHPGPSTLSPGLFTDADTFYGPKVSHGLHADLFTNANNFPAPNVFLDSFVYPPRLNNGSQVIPPLVAFGQFLTAGRLNNVNVFGAATVKRIGFTYVYAKFAGKYGTAQLYVKQAGAWVPVQEAWVKDDGDWKQLFASRD